MSLVEPYTTNRPGSWYKINRTGETLAWLGIVVLYAFTPALARAHYDITIEQGLND